ncbi:MAG: serine hydrolase domain-containing protein [Actinomycetota bacterium]
MPRTPPAERRIEPGPALTERLSASLITDDGPIPLDARRSVLDVLGVAIVVIADGALVVELSSGATTQGRPMTADTVVQVGSVSKPIAAVTVATSVADGTLAWNDPVPAEHVDGGPADPPPTVGALLSHTAGTTVDGFLGYADAASAPTAADVLAGRGDTPPVVVERPAGGFRYSGGGSVLAAEHATAAAGEPSFDALARSQVFEPLGMSSSAFSIDPPDALLDRVSGGALGTEPLANGWQRHPEHAAAGLWTTAADLGRFLAGFAAGLRGETDAVLPRRIAAEMVSPVAPLAPGELGPHVASVGRGWFLDRIDAPTVYRHGGRNIGYTAAVAGTTDGRFGVAVVTNSFPGGTTLADDVITTTIAQTQEWST